MQARAPLMIEHRLIERMLAVVRQALAVAERASSIEPRFVDLAVDFIQMYADRTHHGKEEGILFKALERKELAAADRELMEELIREHVFGRETTRALVAANNDYRAGNGAALAAVVADLRTLVEFYPRHVEKEDKVFFPAARAYFTEEEDQWLLAEFLAFDRRMIHEKYAAIVEGLDRT